MQNLTRREFSVGSLAALALTQVRCGTSGLIVALDVAEVAASAAVPIVLVFTPQLGPFAAVLSTYIKGVSTACKESVTELKSTDPQATQYSKIAGYFAAVVLTSLPTGIVSEVEAAIGAISAAVSIILSIINGSPAPVAKLRGKSAASQALLVKYQAQVKALKSDQERIADILAKDAVLNPQR